jgi:hypothetical protein
MPSTKDTRLLFRSADLYVVRKADDVVIKDDDANARGGRLAIVARRNRFGIGTDMVIDPSIIIDSSSMAIACDSESHELLW